VGRFFLGGIPLEPSPIKHAKTFEEQLLILQDRGIIVDNPQEALSALQKVNYYRLVAYGLTLKDGSKEDAYLEGTTFSKLISIYEFDKKLRQLLLGALESIEIAFRAHISYHHSHEYGALGYLDSSNFSNSEYHVKFLINLERFLKDSKTELFVTHHQTKYSGVFPVWVAIEVLSFSTLSMLFKNLKNKDKSYISKKYYNVHFKYIQSWLHTLTTIRNICAHHGRLYGKKLSIQPQLFDEIREKVSSDEIFVAILVLSKLLSSSERLNLSTSLKALIDEYDEFIDISHLGFPKDWDSLF